MPYIGFSTTDQQQFAVFSSPDINGTKLKLDADGDTSITADTDDRIDIEIAGADDFKFTANNFNVLSGSTLTIDSGATITNSGTASGFGSNVPTSADGQALGSTSLEWSDLYLADGGVIYLGNDQDINITHVHNTGITTSGTFQATTITATTAVVPDASDGAALGTTALEWSDLYIADGGIIYFGDDQEITLTHNADDGLILKHVGTGDGKEPSLTFQAGDTDIAVDDVLGSIFFQAPDEGAGTDAILVAAGIEAVSEGDFSSSSNATKLSFKTASTAVAAETMFLGSGGALQVSDEVSAESFNLPVTLNGTDGSSTDAGDNIVLDASASGVDAGERLLFEGVPSPAVEAGSVIVAASIMNWGEGAGQTFSRATWTTVTGWMGVDYIDSANAFNPTTGVFTCPSDGTYLLAASASMDFDDIGDDGEALHIRFLDGNSVAHAYQLIQFHPSMVYGRWLEIGTTHIIKLSADDTMKVQLYANDTNASGHANLENAHWQILKVA